MLEAYCPKIFRIKPSRPLKSLENCMHISEINTDEVRTIISTITNFVLRHAEIPTSILKQYRDIYCIECTEDKNVLY